MRALPAEEKCQDAALDVVCAEVRVEDVSSNALSAARQSSTMRIAACSKGFIAIAVYV
jgi:hypothetical protein